MQESGGNIDELVVIFRELAKLENKGELGEAIAGHIEKVSIYELAEMCALGEHRLDEFRFSPAHAKAYKQMLTELTFGTYRRILAMKSDGSFKRMSGRIRDRALFTRFCEMMIDARDEIETIYDGSELGQRYGGYHGKVGGLIQCFLMFVVDEPGHPAGTPFPGGSTVQVRNGVYYCPVRGKEKDVKYSMCNFCPAKQAKIL